MAKILLKFISVGSVSNPSDSDVDADLSDDHN